MRKILFLLFAILAMTIAISSCDENSNEKNNWKNEYDSLQSVNTQQQAILDNMTSIMAEISLSLDSIVMQEQIIIRDAGELNSPLNKKNIQSRLSTLSEIIKNQRSKMAIIESTLKNDKTAMGQLRNIIVYLNASLEQKDQEIQKLKQEINRKNYNIAKLNAHVTNFKDTVSIVRQENDVQKQQIAQQDASLNEVYYIIGTKEQLINSGALFKSGIIIKKTKVNFASINKSVLTKADKRTLKIIKINGKSPKIVSEEPKGSYVLEKGDNSSVLNIIDSEKFWSTNNRILVIQVK